MYALLYTTIECVNTLTIQTIYMLNVSICLMYALLYTIIECVNKLTVQTIYMCEHAHYANHLYALMYALLYTTIECVNTLTAKTIYMLNVSTYKPSLCMHCCTRQSNVYACIIQTECKYA